jgi:hypothetical protein
MIKVTVSGSFRRHLHAISSAVQELTDLHVSVLSPSDPRVVGATGEFLFVASDRIRSVRLVQDRHMESIRASDFLWLVAPDGYVGQSASMEIGFAVANSVPIFSRTYPTDLTLRQYVRRVVSPHQVLERVASSSEPSSVVSFLIDPHASIDVARATLERIDSAIRSQHQPDGIAAEVYKQTRKLTETFDTSSSKIPI